MSNKLGRRRRDEMAAKAAGTFIPANSGMPITYYDSMAVTSPHILDDIERTAREHRQRGGREDFVNMDEVDAWDRKCAWRTELQANAMRGAHRSGLPPQICLDALLGNGRMLKTLAYGFEMDMLHLLRHRLSGRATYRIAPGLSDRLVDTRMNVPTARMRLPFKSIMLVFDDETANQALDALCDKPLGNGTITVFVSECTIDGVRRWNLHTTRIRKRALGHVDTMIIRSLALDEAAHAEDALRTEWDERNQERDGRDDMLDEIRGGHETDEKHYNEGMRFYRLIVNTVLYLTSHKPSASEPRVGCIARDTPQRQDILYVVLGEGMTRLDRQTRDALRNGGGRSGGGRMLHQVQGHYKDQVCGPGGRDRVHIFVEPYLRGDDADTLVSRPRLAA